MTEWVAPVKFIPKDYQRDAIKHILSTPGCGLFLKPGRGKTSSTLAAWKILRDKGHSKAVLIVAPLRVVKYTWPAEVSKWEDFEDFSVTILHGPKKDELIAESKTDIYLINFEGLLWLLPKLAKLKPSAWPFDMLVVDESTKLKAYDSKRFKMLKKLLPGFKRRVILTGTPTPQSKMDLFAQAYIMDCGKALSPYITHFRSNYFFIDTSHLKPGEPPPMWGYQLKPGADEAINGRIKHLVYTSDGPAYEPGQEPIFNDVYVELPKDARKKYRDMEKLMFAQLEAGTILASNAAVASGKCRQISNGALYTDDDANYEVIHDEKLEAVDELLEQLVGECVLIWYEYKSDLARLLERFPGEVLTAKSPPDIIERWNARQIPILYVHWQSAAHGLNMQYGGNTMIYFTTPWSGEGFTQGVARLARQGQTEQVIVHRIVARRTVDELVIKAQALRDANQNDFLEALRAYWHDNKQQA